MKKLSSSRVSAQSLETNRQNPSLLFMNLNGSMRIVLSALTAEVKWFELGNVNAYINYEVVPPFYNV